MKCEDGYFVENLIFDLLEEAFYQFPNEWPIYFVLLFKRLQLDAATSTSG